MPKYLRQNTATSTWFGPFVEASDGYSYKATTITLVTTGAVVKILKSNNTTTGLLAQPSLVSPGWMYLPIAATDVDQLGPIKYMMGNATSNLPVWADFTILSANVYDSLISPAASDFLKVNVMTITGSAPSSAAIGSVANLTTGVAVTSIAAGLGVNVSSINAAVGVNVSSINSAAPTTIMFNANLIQILASGVTPTVAQIGANVVLVTGSAPSNAAIGSVANLATGVAVSSIAAGVGVNVSSISAGVNVSSIGGATPSTAIAGALLDYVFATPGAQSITIRDWYRAAAGVLGGKIAGASAAGAISIFGVSGEARVSAVADAFGNRTSVTWVTGP